MAISAFNQKYLDEYSQYMDIQVKAYKKGSDKAKTENTKKTYVVAIGQFLDYISDIKCIDCSIIDADSWLDSLIGRDGGEISNGTRNIKISALNNFYNRIVKRKEMTINPFEGVEVVAVKQKKKEILDDSEIELLKRVLDAESKNPSNCRGVRKNECKTIALRDRAIVNVLLNCGLRNNELCSAKMDQLISEDYNGRTIHYITLHRENNKNKKPRNVYISDKTMKTIQDYRNALSFTPKDNCIFVSQNGLMMSSHDINRICVKCLEIAGIDKRMTPHSFRHTCASRLGRDVNVSIENAALMLGHSPKMFADTYLHQTKDSYVIALD